jgi:prepilin-type N-terminal cleavage/methylation domain-containing protein
MSRGLRCRRPAFTLVELLVAMTLIVILSSLVLLVVVNMGERDGTTDAAGLTRQWLMIAKARAGRDGAPRGVRLITGIDPNNPDKTSPLWVTELQYIEAQPIIVTYPAANGDVHPTGAFSDPAVVFTYTLSPGPPANANPVGTIINLQCQIVNLQAGDAIQIVPNCLLQLPVLGSWHRIMSAASVAQPVQGPGFFSASPGLYTVNVQLDSFPNLQMGAGGVIQPQPQPASGQAAPCYVTPYFGISAPPRPLMGEPALQLPKNICIDLSQFAAPNGPTNPPQVLPPSIPAGVPGTDLDLLFTPNGHVMPIGAGAQVDGQIFLWHRDYTKLKNAPNGSNALVVTSLGPPATFDMYPFQNGGVQQIVAIKCKTGSLGQFPVLWPNANGQYSPGQDAYFFARQGATSP